MSQSKSLVTVNDLEYAWPSTPAIVICCDASEHHYYEGCGGLACRTAVADHAIDIEVTAGVLSVCDHTGNIGFIWKE